MMSDLPFIINFQIFCPFCQGLIEASGMIGKKMDGELRFRSFDYEDHIQQHREHGHALVASYKGKSIKVFNEQS